MNFLKIAGLLSLIALAMRVPNSFAAQKMVDLVASDAPRLPLLLQTAPVNTHFRLAAGEYLLTEPIVFAGLKNVTLRGVGPRTRLTVAAGVPIALEIGAGNRQLSIEHLSIVGAYRSVNDHKVTTHGIGSHEYLPASRPNVQLRFAHLHLSNLAVGISVGSCPSLKAVWGVTIAHNRISDIFGDESGSGYGIHAACADAVTIRDNVITRATRHSIYQGRGNDITISNNQIHEHGAHQAPRPYWRSAIAVARSSVVSVNGNQLINGRDVGISIERDGHEDAKMVSVCNNRWVGDSGKPDIWVNVANATTVALANNQNQRGVATLQLESGLVQHIAPMCARLQSAR